MLRPLLAKLHLYAGLIAGLFLLVAGLSGSVLAFQDEIDHALNPALFRVTEGAPRVSLKDAADAAVRGRPGDRAQSIRLPRGGGESLEIGTAGRALVYVDPYGGRVLGARARESAFVHRVHALHTRLLAGAAGEAVVGVSTAVLLFLLVTGLYLWWPRSAKWALSFTVRWRAPWKKLVYDLHSTLGFYAFGVLFLMAGTGVVLATSSVSYPLIERLTRAPPRAAVQPVVPLPGAQILPVDQAVAIADEALPGAEARAVLFPAGERGAYVVYKRFPEDRTPNGRSRVHVDPYRGATLLVESTRTAPLGAQIQNHVRPLHTGDILGLPTRVLYAAGSAWVTGLFVTGLLLWWSRRRPTREGA